MGEDTPQTLARLGELARSLEDSGQHARAQALFFRCMQAYERLLGTAHPDAVGAREAFRRCNRHLVEMKRKGQRTAEPPAGASVSFGDSRWWPAGARHLESNLYSIYVTIDPAMKHSGSPQILIEGALATYVHSDTLYVTAAGEMVMLATLQEPVDWPAELGIRRH